MRKKTALISFLICTGFLLVYFLFNDYYPFGARSIAWCDMEQQYIPLLLEIKEGSILSGGAGGMSFWGVFFFFVSSPLSLLVFLVRAENVVYLVNIITALKFGLCGLTFSTYLNYDNKDISSEVNVLLSLMYAYSGYNIMYYQNNMWLDIVYMFPLFMIGFRELIKNGRTMPYILCISAIVYLNYYISYMIILFTIIASFFLLMDECAKRDRRINSMKFITSSLAAALITAPVWLVSLIQVMNSGRSTFSSDEERTGLFANCVDKYCLLASVSLVISAVFIMIRDRKFFSHGICRFYKQMTLILIVTAFIDPINRMWHTGDYQAYPLRYGFIIIFIGLAAVGKYIAEVRSTRVSDRKTLCICTAFALIYVAAVIVIDTEKLDSYISELHVSGGDAVIITAFSIIALTVSVFYIYSFKQRQISAKALSGIMSIMFVFETLFSLNIYMKNAPDVSSRYQFTAELSDKIDNDDFYRVKSQKRYFYPNMLEGMGFNTTAHYTSLTSKDFMYAMKRMGYSSYWMDVSSNGGTLVTDAFLMNKYVISVIGDYIGKGVYSSINPLKVYINDDIFEGAVICDVPPEDFGDYTKSDRMEFSELMCSNILKSDNIINKIDDFTSENVNCIRIGDKYKINKTSSDDCYIIYEVEVRDDKVLYFDVFGNYSTNLTENYYNSCDIYVNGKLIEESYPSKKMNGILTLGQFKNQTVEIKINIKQDFEVNNFGLYTFDTNEFQNALQSVNTAEIKKDGNEITITGQGEGYLYIPMAYNKGYDVYLNGRKCETQKCMDAFMAVKLDGGYFKLYAEFYPDGIILSVVISLMGIMLLITFQRNYKKMTDCEKLIDMSYKSHKILAVFTTIVIYIGGFVFWII